MQAISWFWDIRHPLGTALTIYSGRIAKPTFSGSDQSSTFIPVSIKYQITGTNRKKKKKNLLLLGTHYCSFFRLMQKTTGVGITKSAIQHIPSRPLQSKRQRLKPRNSTKIPRFSQPVQSHLVAILNRTYCYSSWTGSFWSHSERCFSTHTKSCMHDGFFPHLYSIEAAEFGPALNIMHSL